MTQRWEYLSLIWREILRPVGEGETTAEDSQFALIEEFETWEAGKECETTAVVGGMPRRIDVFGRLGQEGWELAAAMVVDIAALGPGGGYENYFPPAVERFIFKRLADH